MMLMLNMSLSLLIWVKLWLMLLRLYLSLLRISLRLLVLGRLLNLILLLRIELVRSLSLIRIILIHLRFVLVSDLVYNRHPFRILRLSLISSDALRHSLL